MNTDVQYDKQLEKILGVLGFRPPDDSANPFWIRDYGRAFGIILPVYEDRLGQGPLSPGSFQAFLERGERDLMIKTGKPVYGLLLVVSHRPPSRQLIEETAMLENAWLVDLNEGRLLVYENQIEDFFGIRRPFEEMLIRWSLEPVEIQVKDSQGRNRRIAASRGQGNMGQDARAEWMEILTPVNLLMILINTAVFLGLSMMGDTLDTGFMIRYGALNWELVMEKGEYWRLITSGFLHFGAEHFFHNMLALFLLGSRLENLKGHIIYFAVYMVSLIASALTSLFVTLSADRFSVSAGASGAVFGVIGALIAISLFDILFGEKSSPGRVGRVSFLFMLAFALVGGVTSPEIDNGAHVGGLIAGFVLMVFILLIQRMIRLISE